MNRRITFEFVDDLSLLLLRLKNRNSGQGTEAPHDLLQLGEDPLGVGEVGNVPPGANGEVHEPDRLARPARRSRDSKTQAFAGAAPLPCAFLLTSSAPITKGAARQCAGVRALVDDDLAVDGGVVAGVAAAVGDEPVTARQVELASS